jgi:uncharacterized protein with beta-barrel porin domain
MAICCSLPAAAPQQSNGLRSTGWSVLSDPSIGRSAPVIGAHATLETGTPLQVFAGYDAAFNGRASSQIVSAGIRYSW